MSFYSAFLCHIEMKYIMQKMCNKQNGDKIQQLQTRENNVFY